MGEHKCINEKRLCQLEREGATMANEIKNLVKSLDNLSSWIKGLVLALIPFIGAILWTNLKG